MHALQSVSHAAELVAVAEVISLQLRQPGQSRAYLYPQIFSGLTYLVGTMLLWKLRQLRRRRKRNVNIVE